MGCSSVWPSSVMVLVQVTARRSTRSRKIRKSLLSSSSRLASSCIPSQDAYASGEQLPRQYGGKMGLAAYRPLNQVLVLIDWGGVDRLLRRDQEVASIARLDHHLVPKETPLPQILKEYHIHTSGIQNGPALPHQQCRVAVKYLLDYYEGEVPVLGEPTQSSWPGSPLADQAAYCAAGDMK